MKHNKLVYIALFCALTLLCAAFASCGKTEEPSPETESQTEEYVPATAEPYDHEDIVLAPLEKAPVPEGMREYIIRPLTDTVMFDSANGERREESHKITVSACFPNEWFATDASLGGLTASKSFLTEGDYFEKASDAAGVYVRVCDIGTVYYVEGGVNISPNVIYADPAFASYAGTLTPYPETSASGEAYVYYSDGGETSVKPVFFPITYDRVLGLVFRTDDETLKKCIDTFRVGVEYFAEGENRDPVVNKTDLPEATLSQDAKLEFDDIDKAFEFLSADANVPGIGQEYVLSLKEQPGDEKLASFNGYEIKKGEATLVSALSVKERAADAKKDDPYEYGVSFALKRG